MEDINYVFNGEIKGNFNSYILIYDNLFLLFEPGPGLCYFDFCSNVFFTPVTGFYQFKIFRAFGTGKKSLYDDATIN